MATSMTDFDYLLLFAPPLSRQQRWEPFAENVFEPALRLVKRADDDDSPFTIAVDLDGTLAQKQEPFDPDSVGSPRPGAIDWVRRFKDAGARVVIFTVRGDDDLVRGWLDEHDVPYDYLNENPDQPEGSSGKVIADVYFDDRAVSADDLEAGGAEVLQRIDEESADRGDGAAPSGMMVAVERTRCTLVAPRELLEGLGMRLPGAPG